MKKLLLHQYQGRKMKKITSLIICFLICFGACMFCSAQIQVPVFPNGSKTLFTQTSPTVLTGSTWLTNTEIGYQSYFFDGASSMRFDLNPMQLKPGNYRLGLLVRTGVHWDSADGQISNYRLHLEQADNSVIALGKVQQPAICGSKLLRAGGVEGNWASWYGIVESVLPSVYLNGNEKLIVENLQAHGSVIAIWAQPLHISLISPTLQMPSNPQNSKVLFANTQQLLIDGSAWFNDTKLGYQGYFLDGDATLSFDLSSLNLDPGDYQFGLIARTGTLWDNATNQIANYHLSLQKLDQQTIELDGMQMSQGSDITDLVRVAGVVGSWGSWYGSIESQWESTYLEGTEKLIVHNDQFHGNIVALWTRPIIEPYPQYQIPTTPMLSTTMFTQPNPVETSANTWITDTNMGCIGYFMNGASSVTFNLSSLELKQGCYRIGILARTGTTWDNATNQIVNYRLHLEDDLQSTLLGGMRLPANSTQADLVRSGGVEGSWGSWYGIIESQLPATYLMGDEKLIIENIQGQSSAVAVWVKPVALINAATVQLTTNQPHNAFIDGHSPQLHIQIDYPENQPQTQGYLLLECYDLIEELTQPSTRTYLPVSLTPGQVLDMTMTYPAVPGVYRVRGSLVSKEGQLPNADSQFVYCQFAYTPAKLAGDLPDDWPLATHVNETIPPLPGFKWYRYFAGWSHNNPSEGVYDWENFDQVFSQVQAVGGKLMIAGEGTPLWACSLGKIGMPWSSNATAYPPDDWHDMREYLDLMVQRYEDESGTLGALELCNEANTADRWQGSMTQLIEMAQLFKEAAQAANHPISTVGIVASAGIQNNFVNELINAGILESVDAISTHFYEEMASYESETPISNIPDHVSMLKTPMTQAGYNLPMINSESGIGFVSRENGLLVTQTAINQQAQADPLYNPATPWIIDGKWRSASERRAAASYVSGTVQLMSLGVSRSFYFSLYNFLIDDTPSLPWVALGQLGKHLDGVDYHNIQTLDAHVVGSDELDGSPKAMAILMGQPGQKQLIITWAYISDTSIGRSKIWQDWLDPVEVQISTDILQGEASDLYSRSTSIIENVNNMFTVLCGEEPLFITIN
ncbi:MAG TPA: hypothetical protein DCM28_00585 [Phycisphaerales bacterium]|nr:hypothetical protein [Phycisphaerales bacterium]